MHGQDAASTLLSISDAALATGLSPKALRRRIERGTLSSVLIGGRRRIPTEDLIRHGLMSGRARWAAVDVPEPASEALAALLRRLDALESRVAALEAELPRDSRDDGASPDGGTSERGAGHGAVPADGTVPDGRPDGSAPATPHETREGNGVVPAPGGTTSTAVAGA